MNTLYYRPQCPYCQKVLASIADKDIELTLCDINEDTHRDFLVKTGGKQQVPFLYSESDNIKLYESDAIIEKLGGDKNAPLPDGAACGLH